MDEREVWVAGVAGCRPGSSSVRQREWEWGLGRGMRHTRDGVGCGRGADPGGENVGAGREDVDYRSEVGVRGPVVVDVGGTNGDSIGSAGGAVVGCILLFRIDCVSCYMIWAL